MDHGYSLSANAPFWTEPPLPGLERVLLRCTLDYDRAAETLRYSIVGQSPPSLEAYYLFQSHIYDAWHVGIAPLDFTSRIWTALDAPVDPFP